MNGTPGGAVDRIADNAWLKMIERLAVPLIGLLTWQMYTDVGNMKQQFPLMSERIINLEKRMDKMEARADNARTERVAQYQSIIIEITSLKVQAEQTAKMLQEINAKLGTKR